jgi:hypothetical protein
MEIPNQYRDIFFPYTTRRLSEFQDSHQSFIYYTTAETALKAIRNREIWMRLTGVMNDHSEVQHGVNCLSTVLLPTSPTALLLANSLNGCFKDLYREVSDLFNQWAPSMLSDTFIACMSEHDRVDNEYGKLSMWRAYGGHAGVAFVLNPEIFFSQTQELATYMVPVLYSNPESLQIELSKLANKIHENTSYIQSMGRNMARDTFFHALRFIAVSTKHPAFKEECEWRIVSSPSMQQSEYVKQYQEVIAGIPQPILKIELKVQPSQGLIGLGLEDFIKEILIGPCEFPSIICRSICQELQQKGFNNLCKKIRITGIPLRLNQR